MNQNWKIAAVSAMLICALCGCGMEPIGPANSGTAETTLSSTDLSADSVNVSETHQTALSQTNANGFGTQQTFMSETDALGSEKPASDLNLSEQAVIIRGVPHLDQSTGYATACESLAAVSLLQYYGSEVTPSSFIRQYLPVAPYPAADQNGILHAESPWDYFIGDPLKTNGYGCYSTAIVKGMEAAPHQGTPKVLRNIPLDELCSTYIDNGDPVMIWATIEMAPTRQGHSWILPDGAYFTFIRPEHALLLIGYDDRSYYFSDSLAEDDITAYDREAVQTAYHALYEQAIVIDQAEPDTNE